MAKDKGAKAAGAKGSYFEESRLPFAGFVFVLPLMAIYELGVVLVDEIANARLRNGADALIQAILRQFSRLLPDPWHLHGMFASGVVLALVLLVLHKRTGKPWKARPEVLVGMAAESAVLGLALLVSVGLVQTKLFPAIAARLAADGASALSGVSPVSAAVLSLGAGVYEELVFRLLMVTVIAGLLRMLFQSPPGWATFLALVLSAVLFSLAHFGAEEPSWARFLFRFVAGLLFSALYQFRGFGIAAGTHAAYDLFITLLARAP